VLRRAQGLHPPPTHTSILAQLYEDASNGSLTALWQFYTKMLILPGYLGLAMYVRPLRLSLTAL
jgi:hypothetical protein